MNGNHVVLDGSKAVGEANDTDWRNRTASDSDFIASEKLQREVLRNEVWTLLRKMGVSRNRLDSSNASSSTAEIACFMRHLAYHNPHTSCIGHGSNQSTQSQKRKTTSEVREGDDLAVHFIHEEHRLVAQSDDAAELICEVYDEQFPGLFGHVAARTRVYDSIVSTHAPDVEQVVILGAGFDSRAYRMECLNPKLRKTPLVIFEVDAPGTQAAKKMKLKEAKISNKAVRYVPVNFESENFADKLVEAGFDKMKRTLWTWEFVSPYLTPDAVSSTIVSLWKISKPSSLLAFDYCYKDFETFHGGAGLHRAVVQSGEAIKWTVPVGKMKPWLAKHSLSLETEFGPRELEEKFLTNKKTGKEYKSFGFYAIVLSKCVEFGSLTYNDEDIEEYSPMAEAPQMDADAFFGDASTIRTEILDLLQRHTEAKVEDVDIHKNLIESTGLDSLQAVAVAKDIQVMYNVEVTEAFILNPTTSVDALSKYIASKAIGFGLSASDDVMTKVREEIKEMLFVHTETRVEDDDTGKNLIESTGLDSLQAVAFAKDIHKNYGVEITEAFILNPSTSVDTLAEFIASKSSSVHISTETKNKIEKEIIDILEKHTESKVPEDALNKNLIESTGLDSLQAIAVVKEIHAKYNIEITEAFILNPMTSVETLTTYIASSLGSDVKQSILKDDDKIQDVQNKVMKVEKVIFQALSKQIKAVEAAEFLFIGDNTTVVKLLKSEEKQSLFLNEIKKSLQIDEIPSSVLHSSSGSTDLVSYCVQHMDFSTTAKRSVTSSHRNYDGLIFQPMLRRSGNSPKLPGTDKIPEPALGTPYRIMNFCPSAVDSTFARCKKIVSVASSSGGMIDADKDSARILGWSTKEPLSWYLLQHDTRLLLYPDVGFELDFPYEVDISKMVKSLKETLAFFPILCSRLAYENGRIIAIRGERGRQSGVKLTKRKFGRFASPLLKDMFVLETRKLLPGDAKMPWYGQYKVLKLEEGSIIERVAKSSAWWGLATSNSPFVPHVAHVDFMTNIPVLAPDQSTVKGTRLTVAMNHCVADGFIHETFMQMWCKIHREGFQSVLDSVSLSPRVDSVVQRIGYELMEEERNLLLTKTSVACGMEGILYALGNDNKADIFKGVLRQKSLDELRSILPEAKRKIIPDSDLALSWLWMTMVNVSVRHWKEQKSVSRWYPSVAFSKSLRFLYPELQTCSGNLMRQIMTYCPLENGIGREDLDDLTPLTPTSPCMPEVILNLNKHRNRANSVAFEAAAKSEKVPGVNVQDSYYFEETRRESKYAGPTIYINDMSSLLNSTYEFEENKHPAHIFFSTEGLAGKMGLDGDFKNGCLSLSVNTRLFSDYEQYKHMWFVQWACNPSIGCAMNIILSHNY